MIGREIMKYIYRFWCEGDKEVFLASSLKKARRNLRRYVGHKEYMSKWIRADYTKELAQFNEMIHNNRESE